MYNPGMLAPLTALLLADALVVAHLAFILFVVAGGLLALHRRAWTVLRITSYNVCYTKLLRDAVLNYEKHEYLFFCAKEDFSGYHNFAKTLSQHNKNARLYQQALNRRKIYR